VTIFKLYGWHGEAEVLSALRRVSYDEDGLHVHDITLLEANEIISFLSTGKLTGKVVSADQRSKAMDVVLSAPEAEEIGMDSTMDTVVAEKASGESPPTQKEESEKKAETKENPEPKDKEEKQATEPEKKQPEKAAKEEKAVSKRKGRTRGSKNKSKEETPETKATEDKAEDEPTNGKGEARDWVKGEGEDGKNGYAGKTGLVLDPGVLEELKTMERFRGVLETLVEYGYDSHEELQFICEAIKEDVPVLGRCANLADRVSRIAESMDI
jgi:hypothetical protein